MCDNGRSFHYVCTLDEARELLEGHDRFWSSECSCRKSRGPCKRSRSDVCLYFYEDTSASKEISRNEALFILRESRDKQLIPRPYRNDDHSRVDGICFCCDDCCEYFQLPGRDECDKGNYIELTEMESCSHCGVCQDICYFGARKILDGKLNLYRGNCYGCGVCVDVCPAQCIRMVRR